VLLKVQTPTRQVDIKLTYVAYILGFFISVIGLLHSRLLRVYFNLEQDCLY
jgi:hypothetical protein